MCNRPISRDGFTFACRSCDDCIATRRQSWVARAMMERATSPHSLCVTLTYSDDTQANRDAAQVFAYVDVRALVQRITAALRRIDPTHWVRFICAGEQGTRNNRCHWHIVLFSSYDLRKLGHITRSGKHIVNPDRMMSTGKRKRRLHWSLWADNGHPKGFVTFGAADQAGMHYVMSYCLKDQFTPEKARGTMRETKVEAFATGLFRMSKRPSIGEAWLVQKVEALATTLSVLPSLDLKVPGLSGFFHPSGSFRKKVLWHCSALNNLARFRRGDDAPQWGGLLQSLKDNPPDVELLNGKQEDPEDFIDPAALIVRKAAYRADEFRRRREVFLRPYRLFCQSCLGKADNRQYLPRDGWIQQESLDGVYWSYQSLDGSKRSLSGLALSAVCGDNTWCQDCGGSLGVIAVPREDHGAA